MSMSVASAWELWHFVRREADRRGAHHVRLVPSIEGVEMLFDAGGPVEGARFSSSGLPALSMRLRRLRKKSGWHVETFPAGFGPAIHVVRLHSDARPTHPADWTDLVGGVRERRDGLTVMIGPDAYTVRHALARVPGVTDADAWKSQTGPGLYDADDAAGRELALHAALRGLPVVAVASREDEPWWEAVDGAVPIRILKARRTPYGFAWEAYACPVCR